MKIPLAVLRLVIKAVDCIIPPAALECRSYNIMILLIGRSNSPQKDTAGFGWSSSSILVQCSTEGGAAWSMLSKFPFDVT